MQTGLQIILSALAFIEPSGEGFQPSVEDLTCLTDNIYHEARGEPLVGQVAVATVTLNRMESSRFPDTICKVVYQPKQFSWVLDNVDSSFDAESYRVAAAVAALVISGDVYDPTHGALFYYAPKYANPSWSQNYTFAVDLANHRFLVRDEM